MSPLVLFSDDLIADHPPLHWFWKNRIAKGSFNLLIGHPGVGKSILAAELAAHVTAGTPWPDAPEDCPTRATDYPPHRGAVLYVSAEDSLTSVLARRLNAAGANLDFVAFLRDVATDNTNHHKIRFSLRHHLDLLAQAIRSVSAPNLVILDTLTSLLASPLRDPCDPAPLARQVSAAVVAARLQELAQRYGVTIIALAHVARRSESTALLRAHAALPFVGSARSAMWLTHDLRDPHTRHLVWLKSVESDTPLPLALQIDDGPRVRWIPPHALPPSAQLDTTDDRRDLLCEAANWLESKLANGPLPATEILTAARAHGFSTTLVHRAKRIVGVVSKHTGFDAPWRWMLACHSDKSDTAAKCTEDGKKNVTQ